MSPADDVMEMQGICTEVANLLGLPDDLKTRTNEVRRLFGRDDFSWNRINEFLRAKAHRVDGWEKDHGRRVREEIREAAKRRKAADHIAWFRSTIEHLRTTDEEFHLVDVDGLERVLARAGIPHGSMDVPGPTEADAGFDQREGWGR